MLKVEINLPNLTEESVETVEAQLAQVEAFVKALRTHNDTYKAHLKSEIAEPKKEKAAEPKEEKAAEPKEKSLAPKIRILVSSLVNDYEEESNSENRQLIKSKLVELGAQNVSKLAEKNYGVFYKFLESLADATLPL